MSWRSGSSESRKRSVDSEDVAGSPPEQSPAKLLRTSGGAAASAAAAHTTAPPTTTTTSASSSTPAPLPAASAAVSSSPAITATPSSTPTETTASLMHLKTHTASSSEHLRSLKQSMPSPPFRARADECLELLQHFDQAEHNMVFVGARGEGKSYAVNYIVAPAGKGQLPLPSNDGARGLTHIPIRITPTLPANTPAASDTVIRIGGRFSVSLALYSEAEIREHCQPTAVPQILTAQMEVVPEVWRRALARMAGSAGGAPGAMMADDDDDESQALQALQALAGLLELLNEEMVAGGAVEMGLLQQALAWVQVSGPFRFAEDGYNTSYVDFPGEGDHANVKLALSKLLGPCDIVCFTSARETDSVPLERLMRLLSVLDAHPLLVNYIARAAAKDRDIMSELRKTWHCTIRKAKEPLSAALGISERQLKEWKRRGEVFLPNNSVVLGLELACADDTMAATTLSGLLLASLHKTVAQLEPALAGCIGFGKSVQPVPESTHRRMRVQQALKPIASLLPKVLVRTVQRQCSQLGERLKRIVQDCTGRGEPGSGLSVAPASLASSLRVATLLNNEIATKLLEQPLRRCALLAWVNAVRRTIFGLDGTRCKAQQAVPKALEKTAFNADRNGALLEEGGPLHGYCRRLAETFAPQMTAEAFEDGWETAKGYAVEFAKAATQAMQANDCARSMALRTDPLLAACSDKLAAAVLQHVSTDPQQQCSDDDAQRLVDSLLQDTRRQLLERAEPVVRMAAMNLLASLTGLLLPPSISTTAGTKAALAALTQTSKEIARVARRFRMEQKAAENDPQAFGALGNMPEQPVAKKAIFEDVQGLLQLEALGFNCDGPAAAAAAAKAAEAGDAESAQPTATPLESAAQDILIQRVAERKPVPPTFRVEQTVVAESQVGGVQVIRAREDETVQGAVGLRLEVPKAVEVRLALYAEAGRERRHPMVMVAASSEDIAALCQPLFSPTHLYGGQLYEVNDCHVPHVCLVLCPEGLVDALAARLETIAHGDGPVDADTWVLSVPEPSSNAALLLQVARDVLLAFGWYEWFVVPTHVSRTSEFVAATFSTQSASFQRCFKHMQETLNEVVGFGLARVCEEVQAIPLTRVVAFDYSEQSKAAGAQLIPVVEKIQKSGPTGELAHPSAFWPLYDSLHPLARAFVLKHAPSLLPALSVAGVTIGIQRYALQEYCARFHRPNFNSSNTLRRTRLLRYTPPFLFTRVATQLAVFARVDHARQPAWRSQAVGVGQALADLVQHLQSVDATEQFDVTELLAARAAVSAAAGGESSSGVANDSAGGATSTVATGDGAAREALAAVLRRNSGLVTLFDRCMAFSTMGKLESSCDGEDEEDEDGEGDGEEDEDEDEDEEEGEVEAGGAAAAAQPSKGGSGSGAAAMVEGS